MDMKYCAQETRSSLINNYLFADNDFTMQSLPRSGKFVNKANVDPENNLVLVRGHCNPACKV